MKLFSHSQSQVCIDSQKENDGRKEVIRVPSSNSHAPIPRIDSMSIARFPELIAKRNIQGELGRSGLSNSGHLPGFYD